MPGNNISCMCCECELKFSDATSHRYHCRSCGRILCGNCFKKSGCLDVDLTETKISITDDAETCIKFCKVCLKISRSHGEGKYCDKIYPSDSPLQSPEQPSPCFSGQRTDGYSSHAEIRDNVSPLIGRPSPILVRRSPSRSDEEGDYSARSFFSPSSDYGNDGSDIDSSSLSLRRDFYSFKSYASSSYDSPSRIHIISNRGEDTVNQEHCETPKSQSGGSFNQDTMVVKYPETGNLENNNQCSNDMSMFNDRGDKFQKPLDFDNNTQIWLPPAPEDEYDEIESNLFAYDDDDEIGDSGADFSSCSSLSNMLSVNEKQNDGPKEPLRDVVQGHFRALVSQLLQGEGIKVGKENSKDDWLDVVARVAWQAGNFVRPDTSKEGSMDPVDYVKVKCIASGSPIESTLVKGIVCTKNIKHKRMTSQYKNTRLLILGGALEYQRVPNKLSSFTTLLEQEINNLKVIVSKIEAHRPNVLLVEKTVASYAQEYLLAKEISLVLNVKRPLLERIARCTGASITPTIDNLSAATVGNCALFHVEKVSEELECVNQLNKRPPTKTLMFFEGCPRRLGCTVLLKGSSREELKKIKHVVRYAVFAAYHLSLETSFLADEGASLPRISSKHSLALPEWTNSDNAISIIPNTVSSEVIASQETAMEDSKMKLQNEEDELAAEHVAFMCIAGNEVYDAHNDDLVSNAVWDEISNSTVLGAGNSTIQENFIIKGEEEKEPDNCEEEASEVYSAADSQQSILVSFSSRCVLNETVCERSQLLRIKFYGSFDKPLGRYLRDDLFDLTPSCRKCSEPAEAHVLCYTHQQGNLTINVRSLTSMKKLHGERDGKIWMWHRCLKCPQRDGVPPATHRVIMSDAAWGLSFGKFLELSFSNHATANRVASCGHSLQKDCLRFYGFGSMVASFRYSPIDILSVHLPSSVLEFKGHFQQEWLRKEADELLGKMEALYSQLSVVIDSMEQKCLLEFSDQDEFLDHIMDFKDQLVQEREDYEDFLQPDGVLSPNAGIDILELNRFRRSLILNSHVWGQRLGSLDSLLKTKSAEGTIHQEQKEDSSLSLSVHNFAEQPHKPHPEVEVEVAPTSIDKIKSTKSNLSETIDSAWTGTTQPFSKPQLLKTEDGSPVGSTRQMNQNDSPTSGRIMSPTRVYSFDSALRLRDRIRKGLPPSSLYLSTLRSFHASGDYRNMVRDPVSNMQRKFDPLLNSTPLFISSMSFMPEGGRFFPQTGINDLVITVYDNEPTSIISHALSSKDYENWISGRPNVGNEGSVNVGELSRENSTSSSFSVWPSFGSLDLDHIHFGNYGSESSLSSTVSGLFTDSKSSPHPKISFGDDSSVAGGKVRFSVTCYFAKQFVDLRKKCCPSEVDFIRSLSRCKRWGAQGGKSNVYFAKSLDERFIIKQVQKTELESFEEFAPEYFRYLTDSLNSGSPTCLAKVLGIYQVSVKNLKGGKEIKMDLMVMENLFFKRSISRIYDLKGSARSRYNAETTGTNNVLLDMNLIKTLRTKPIFLGSKAKRKLERAVWNDTSFLASVDVMDYSLLVGFDDERKELVLGIIDFIRQYTWDKHLETWVKASGILGGPKNESPTIISPKQYKKRFRKAMTNYFLTVPDQWSS
ncbi:putative 1-phosphatidylinositol-3-phosphate 5-kinase FAB1C [Impatiens glandulifera]|uniref:putative 1-phosphatidylinositol-3-phosphate 5-kinase FAB1C n=1 Tax=Impatiens glandulifera TaxID=253017 RepID=UPI001FB12E26|nr:putative 1-phosphatidylinositol-3-phosphate 5-kinase FAB1C [Impatiens glandulifera]